MDGKNGGSQHFEPDVAGIRLRGDELDRYIEFHEELYRTIRHLVFSTPETSADACSFAWLQFLRYQPPRGGNWKGWMVTTAQREAWRLTAIEWRDRDLSEAEVKARCRSTRAIASRSAWRSTLRCKSSRSCRRRCSGSC